jgi:hypothetical protein
MEPNLSIIYHHGWRQSMMFGSGIPAFSFTNSCLNFMSGNWAWTQAVSRCYYLFDLTLIFVMKDIIAENPKTHGSVFCPIILSSDKTTVSVATGHKEYWLIYLSISNIHNNIRWAHRNGVVLLSFLPISKCKYYAVCMSCIFANMLASFSGSWIPW